MRMLQDLLSSGGLLLVLVLRPCLSNIVLEIGEVEKIRMGEVGTIEFRLSGESSSQEVYIYIEVAENSSDIINLLNTTVTFSQSDIRRSVPKFILVEGIILGINHLKFLYNDEVLHTEPISVIINDLVLNQVFMLVMTIMVIVNTMNMGAQLDVHVIKEVFKRPIGPLVGFVSQFLFMPGISFIVGYLFTDDKLFRLGLFVLGCSPGGNGSNFWTLLLGGDINLSITMTFISTIAALGMMPLWIFIMGPYLTDGDLVIPFGQLIMSLVGLILPIALGMWIRWKWEKAGKLMEKVIVPFTMLTVIFILTAGVYINLFIFQLITPLMVAAGFVVAASGYVFGAGLAWIFRLPTAQITAVSIETSFQNGGIAFVLLKMSFPEPLGELASVAPVAQLMITGLPLWLVLAVLKIYQRYCRKEQQKEEYSPIKLETKMVP